MKKKQQKGVSENTCITQSNDATIYLYSTCSFIYLLQKYYNLPLLLFFKAALLFLELFLKSETVKTLAPDGTPLLFLGDLGGELKPELFLPPFPFPPFPLLGMGLKLFGLLMGDVFLD